MFLSYLPLGIYVFMLHELIEDKLRHVYWGNFLHITSSVYKKEVAKNVPNKKKVAS